MRVNLESTTRVVDVFGAPGRMSVPGRIWEGETDSGIPVFAVITRIAVAVDSDRREFEAELVRCADPSPESSAAVPARLVL